MDEQRLNRQIVRTATEIRRILEERAQAFSQVPQDTKIPGDAVFLTTFPVGDERYGVETHQVMRIQPFEQRTYAKVPGTPSFIIGAVNIRGHIYSVMDVSQYLGKPARPISATAHVLLVQSGRKDAGNWMECCILTDGMPGVAMIHKEDLQLPSAVVSDRARKYVRGITQDMLTVLDLDRLLLDPNIVIQDTD